MNPILTVTLNPALDISASVDEIIVGPKLRCDGGQIDAGGGGVNVSRAIKILGGRSCTFVATAGLLGEILVQELSKHDMQPIRYETDGHTRQSLSVAEGISGKQLRLILPGPIWTQAQIDGLLGEITKHIHAGAYIVATGSLPPGIADDFYIRLNTAVLAKGAMMVLDTSGETLFTSVRDKVHPYKILRMDRLEAEELAGHTFLTPFEMVNFAQKLVNDGIAETIIMARGAEGSVFATKTERFHILPPKTPVRSVVGAGDTFVGGLVLAMSRNEPLVKAGVLAASAASSAVQTKATDLCVREVAEAIMPTCKITHL